MAQNLSGDITEGGMGQGDLVKLLGNVRDLANELQADHATFKALCDEQKTDYTALLADVTAVRLEVIDLVTDMANRIANHNTLIAKLNLDGGVTDEDYAAATAAVATNPAALTATAIAASSPATLAAATALTLNRS